MSENEHHEEATKLLSDNPGQYVVIPKAELPEVHRDKFDPNTYHADGQSIVYLSEENARQWCLRDIAVWQFIANEEDARAGRRDELAREFGFDGWTYENATPMSQRAIDRIIELEATK